MKILAHIFLILGVNFCWATDSTNVQAEYCGLLVTVKGCETSEKSIQCGEQLIQWFYQTEHPVAAWEQIAQSFFEAIIHELEKNDWDISKEPTDFVSLGYDLKGWKVTTLRGKEKRHFLWAYGKVKSEYVTIHCNLASQKPKKNKALPKFVKTILQMKE